MFNFAKLNDIVDVDKAKCSGYIPCIWEDDSFEAINSDDFEMKMLQELLLSHYISRRSKSRSYSGSAPIGGQV